MATGSIPPFTPLGTVAVSASTSSASASLESQGDTVLFFNSTSAIAFVAVGGTGLVATQASVPVPPNGTLLLAAGPFCTTAAVLLSSGSGTVYVTSGNGVAR